MRQNRAFTLVELLVIIGLIAILASMTLPTYEMNTTKARIARVIPVLDRLMHDVLVGYATQGSTPNSLYGVTGIGTGGYGSYLIPNSATNLHYINGSGWANKGAMIAINIPSVIGQGIPGFVESTNGTDGAFNSIVMAFYDQNGTIMIYCGRWDSSSTIYIPVDYLPPGCNNDNFISTVMG